MVPIGRISFTQLGVGILLAASALVYEFAKDSGNRRG